MTAAELIDDLRRRLDRGIEGMERMAQDAEKHPGRYVKDDALRLRSKAQGLRIARDWLRSYPNEEQTNTPASNP